MLAKLASGVYVTLLGLALGWFVNSGSARRLSAAEQLELAQRFAPTLRFDSRELFVPIPRSVYISLTQLKRQEARRSHANYFRAGLHPVQASCRRLLGGACVSREILSDVSNGRGVTLRLGSYRLAELTGPVFIGVYGSGNYVVLTRPDTLSDPRTRTLWFDPLRPLR